MNQKATSIPFCSLLMRLRRMARQSSAEGSHNRSARAESTVIRDTPRAARAPTSTERMLNLRRVRANRVLAERQRATLVPSPEIRPLELAGGTRLRLLPLLGVAMT